MSTPALLLWGGGVLLIIIGYLRAREPWSRYRALQAQEANLQRYRDWRGGVRSDESSGPTGASEAMRLYRSQAQRWGLLAIAGLVAVFVGFLLR
jgi:hypothetical protein